MTMIFATVSSAQTPPEVHATAPATASPSTSAGPSLSPSPSPSNAPTAPTAPLTFPNSQPLSLSAVTSAALQQVSMLGQARLDEQIVAEDLRQARAALLPRIRDAFTVTYNSPAHPAEEPSSPSFIAANAIREYQNLLGVAGDVNFGLISAIRRGQALLRAARAGSEIARRAFLRGVNESYYGAALATSKRSTAQQSLSAAEEFEHNTELNFHAGEVPEVDLIRARLQTAARRDELAQARQSEAVANATLATLLGQHITSTPTLEPLPQAIDVHELDAVAAAGVLQRPELLQFDAQLQAARSDVAVARADFLPHITYSVDEGFDTNTTAASELRKHRGILATANIDVPLFDWGVTRSRQRQAQLRMQAAQLQREIGLRDLYLQFATARQEATTAVERVQLARDALVDAERNVTISIARYRAGEAPISEATDAQTTLAQQRLSLQQALYDYQVARAHLNEAAGR